MKNRQFFWTLCLTLALAGCATGRSYQSDLDTLNSRLNSLQSEMASKDEELARLRAEQDASQGAKSAELARLEAENRALGEQLQSVLNKLQAQRVTPAAAPSRPKIEESDLK